MRFSLHLQHHFSDGYSQCSPNSRILSSPTLSCHFGMRSPVLTESECMIKEEDKEEILFSSMDPAPLCPSGLRSQRGAERYFITVMRIETGLFLRFLTSSPLGFGWKALSSVIPWHLDSSGQWLFDSMPPERVTETYTSPPQFLIMPSHILREASNVITPESGDEFINFPTTLKKWKDSANCFSSK